MATMKQELPQTLPEGVPAAGSLVEEKKAVRKLAKAALRQLSEEDRIKEDAEIQARILEADFFRNARALCAYIACKSLREVDTQHVIKQALHQGKVLYVPRVEDRNSHMRMLRIADVAVDCAANSMNILEPTPADRSGAPRCDVMQAEEPVDVILMPGLAFDMTGRRLGRGGGYYDVFLQDYLARLQREGWKRPLLVALAYKCQIRGDVLVDTSDQLVDALVTADGLQIVARSRENL